MKCYIYLEADKSLLFYNYIFSTKLIPALESNISNAVDAERIIKTVFAKNVSHIKKRVVR